MFLATQIKIFTFLSDMAARLGFEPRTCRLTAGCSTAELTGHNNKAGMYLTTKNPNIQCFILIKLLSPPLVFSWHPLQDSNSYLQVRSLMFYPLN